MNQRRKTALLTVMLFIVSTMILSGCENTADICMEQRFEISEMFAETSADIDEYPVSEQLHIYSLYQNAWERTDGSDPAEYFRDVPADLAVSLADLPTPSELRPDLIEGVTEEKLAGLGAWLNVSASDAGADFILYGLDLDLYSGGTVSDYFQQTMADAPLLRLTENATGTKLYVRLTEFTPVIDDGPRRLVYRMNESTVRNQFGCSPAFLYDKMTNDESETGFYDASLVMSWMNEEEKIVETTIPVYGVNEFISPEEQYADLIGEIQGYDGGVGHADQPVAAFFGRMGRSVAYFFVALVEWVGSALEAISPYIFG